MTSRLHVRRSGWTIVLALSTLCIASMAVAQMAPVSAGAPDPQLVEDLVAANRILADHGLLDGWGHVSVRHNRGSQPLPDGTRIVGRTRNRKGHYQFDLDSRPVDSHGLPTSALFTERYIHGEIYKLRPDVIAVVHTHAPSLIPFGVTNVPLKPMIDQRTK